MGPSAIRYAGLVDQIETAGRTCTEAGNLTVPVVEGKPSDTAATDRRLLAETNEVCRQLADAVAESIGDGQLPLVLGGDHSISIGSISGAAREIDLGVLWFDAHGDFNTPQTSPSGNIHGMPLAHLLGHGDPRLLDIWGGGAVLAPQDVVFIGLRSLDSDERRFVRDHDIRAFTMKEIDKRGIAEVAEEALRHLSHVDRIHVSFDADVLDPDLAPGVGTPGLGQPGRRRPVVRKWRNW
jgi:arginase